MQHLTVADKSLLLGDGTTDLLMRYAALMAQIRGGDTVRINTISGTGDETVATLLLNSGTAIVAEIAHSSQPEPDNTELEQYLQQRLASYSDYTGHLSQPDSTDQRDR